METKECKQCKKLLLANSDFYFKKKDTKDGWTNKCKLCMGKTYTDKLTRVPKQGYKFCIKCNRELPAKITYFPPTSFVMTV